MPYEIVCDGEVRDLADIQYLLSPQDLAAYDLVPGLIELGVASLKIEGRLKTPEYVANITRHYRQAIDAAVGRPAGRLRPPRGPGDGAVLLAGVQPRLPRRQQPQGPGPGRLRQEAGGLRRRGRRAWPGRGSGSTSPRRSSPATAWSSTATRPAGVPEQGGRVYEVARPGRRGPAIPVGPEGLAAGPAELGFGRRDLDLRRLRARPEGLEDRRPRADPPAPPDVRGAASPEGRARPGRPGRRRRAAPDPGPGRATEPGPRPSPTPRSPPAENRPATVDDLRDQLDRLGGTIYELAGFEAAIEGGPLVPRSVLNALRRDLVERLDADAPRPAPGHRRGAGPARPPARAVPTPTGRPGPTLSALCRTTAQVEAAVAAGVRRSTPSIQDIKGYREAVAAARAVEGVSIFLATPRIQKPGEANIFRYLAKQGADGLLVRNAGGLLYLRRPGRPVRGRLLAERRQRAGRRAATGPGGPAGRGLLRPELRPARRPARGGPARTGWRS